MSERLAHRLLAVIAGLAVLLALPVALGRMLVLGSVTPPLWTLAQLAGVLAAIAGLARATAHGTSPVRPARLGVAVVAAGLLVETWLHAGSGPPTFPPALAPLSAPAVALCAVGWRGLRAVAVTLLFASGVVALRTSDGWLPAPLFAVGIDGLFLVGTGVAATVAADAVRDAGKQVSQASRAAAQAFAAADAVEQEERTRWAGVVHDDVLSALQAAAHGDDPPSTAGAAAAASTALARLREPARSEGVTPAELVRRLTAGAHDVVPAADVRLDAVAGEDGANVPGPVGDAVLGALTELLRNAARHGSRPGRSAHVVVRGVVSVGDVRLTAEDDGRGFRPEKVPEQRMGLRVSVAARMRAVGGSARWDSAPGRGTRAGVCWPDDGQGR